VLVNGDFVPNFASQTQTGPGLRFGQLQVAIGHGCPPYGTYIQESRVPCHQPRLRSARVRSICNTLKFTKKRFARHCTSISEPGTVIIDHSERLGILLILIYHPAILHKSRENYDLLKGAHPYFDNTSYGGGFAALWRY